MFVSASASNRCDNDYIAHAHAQSNAQAHALTRPLHTPAHIYIHVHTHAHRVLQDLQALLRARACVCACRERLPIQCVAYFDAEAKIHAVTPNSAR